MFDYRKFFNEYCAEYGLDIELSFTMPEGYENANGTFDEEKRVLYINEKYLESEEDYVKAYYLFHELRHASQYRNGELFDEMITRSLSYIIQYDGMCYKFVDGIYKECRLSGSEEYFTKLYLGQPHEVDANRYAYERVKGIYGDSKELEELYRFWMPKEDISNSVYEEVYREIDERTSMIQ